MKPTQDEIKILCKSETLYVLSWHSGSKLNVLCKVWKCETVPHKRSLKIIPQCESSSLHFNWYEWCHMASLDPNHSTRSRLQCHMCLQVTTRAQEVVVCRIFLFSRVNYNEWFAYLLYFHYKDFTYVFKLYVYISSLLLKCPNSTFWSMFQIANSFYGTKSSEVPNLNIELINIQWRHNGRDVVSNHQPHRCLYNRLFRRRSKKTPTLRTIGLCVGNSPVTGEFLAKNGQ